MAKHCGKHDIIGDECWCCEEQAMSAEDRVAAYQDPAFLAKRGGADRNRVLISHAMNRLSQLTPEQIDRLMAVAGVTPGGAAAPSSSGRTRVAVA
jgi:hypothetical protein